MRIYRIRDDILFCLVIAFLASWGAGRLAGRAAALAYDSYAERHQIPDGEIGGRADEDFFQAQSVDDILSHERFTLVYDIMTLYDYGTGFYEDSPLYCLKLPSGEYVAASVYIDSAVKLEDFPILGGEYLLPVGTAVYADLAQDKDFMAQIESRQPLTGTDFYIDMSGNSPVKEEEDFTKPAVSAAQAITGVAAFSLFHMAGARLGVFPSFFMPGNGKKKKSEWE